MKWNLYDELINAIPPDLIVSDCLVGLHWIAVHSLGTGLAATPSESQRSIGIAGGIVGIQVRELAHYVKSWNNYEASLGLAAINSVFNIPSGAERLLGHCLAEGASMSAFDFYEERYRGKRVAVIGHFPGVESLAEICELSVLERCVRDGDYPDPACEYILPKQDFVFITGATLANKTLPRLLELSGHAYTVMVGPSVPLTPIMFAYNVDALAGSVVIDRDTVWRFIQEGARLSAFKRGICKVQAPCSVLAQA